MGWRNIFIVAIMNHITLEYEEVFVMTDRGGFLGGFFGDNCAILFFILVFLILFVSPRGFGFADPK